MKLSTLLLFLVHGLAWCAEKPQPKTYVAHDIVFNETDNEQTILNNINKLIIKRSVDRSVSCCNESMSIAKVQTHLINHHSKREGYSCPDCSYISSDARYVKNHYLQVHQRLNLYNCPKCSKILKSHETLKVHATRCLAGLLSTTRAIRNDKITLALNEKISTLAPDRLSKYKINFKNLRDLTVCLKNNKIGRYYHCLFKSCINSNTDIDDVISCSLKHLDNEVFTCPNCSMVKDSYEKLKTHYQTCNESVSEASSQDQMAKELIPVNQQEQSVWYDNSIPQYGSDQLHPSDIVLQRVTSNILNAPFAREDKKLTDREKLVMILAQRLESQK